jgi:glycosyltransferase involved in cell wall biosynthesis
MAAGNAVLAHDNPYNRWVAADGALYFRDVDDAAARIDELVGDAALRAKLGTAARARHTDEFTWEHVAGQYQRALEELMGGRTHVRI